ncbi:MAG: metallophosphatase, partial [Erysipelotrichaceae bacterium]|nr:metallophosphatase [Erysipelotrichaceae bacterium]
MKDNLVLLHSNDMHGDFLAEARDGQHIGGVSLLSGYAQKTRQENANVLYAIAGDMFKGSVIDSEFLGFSTIEIMNYLNPDIVALGNHELDYGLTHLLFLEKCARFPIINANMYIKSNHVRLFSPYEILEVNGLRIMFIAVITEEVLSATRSEPIVGTFVDVWEAARQVGIIIDNYKTTSVDLTVLLTHIGYKNDIELARVLNPKWGVDLIIGGHSHTLLSKPKVVNDIPIVQVGVGTDQIGRFDIEIDRDEHTMTAYSWQVLLINSQSCPVDEVLEKVLSEYKNETDRKYGRLLTILNRQLTMESKRQES